MPWPASSPSRTRPVDDPELLPWRTRDLRDEELHEERDGAQERVELIDDLDRTATAQTERLSSSAWAVGRGGE